MKGGDISQNLQRLGGYLLVPFAIILAVFAWRYFTAEPDWNILALQAAATHDRLIVVLAKNTTAKLWAYEKKEGVWAEYLHASGFVGRNGISSDKREGDGTTPAGLYSLRRAFGNAEDPGSHLPYQKLKPDDFWVDDPASRYYNTMVKGDVLDRDWSSAEELSAETIAYKYAVVIEYNTDSVTKGAGSAIFLHCDQGRPTAGCVSVPEEVMIRLLRFIHSGDGIIIASSARELIRH